jgi:hypothetical protein
MVNTTKNSEKRDRLAESYLQKKEKYVYYILALNVTSIGFTITQLIDQKSSYALILVAIALVFWSISFFNGIRFLLKSLSTIYTNINLLDYTNLRHPNYLNVENNTEIINKALMELTKEANSKTTKYFKTQLLGFYAGAISMFIWVFVSIVFK